MDLQEGNQGTKGKNKVTIRSRKRAQIEEALHHANKRQAQLSESGQITSTSTEEVSASQATIPLTESEMIENEATVN